MRKAVVGLVVLAALTLVGVGVWMGTSGAKTPTAPSGHHGDRRPGHRHAPAVSAPDEDGTATVRQQLSVACTTLAGSLDSGVGTVSGCRSYDPSGDTTRTGGFGEVAIASYTSLKVRWDPPFEGGSTMVIKGSADEFAPEENDTGGTCPSGTDELVLTGSVVRDTRKSGVGGATTAEICFNFTTTTIDNEPGSLVEIFHPQRH